jgi:hypothetical protein
VQLCAAPAADEVKYYFTSKKPQNQYPECRMQFEIEWYNSTLANLSIEELGGIPPMLPVMDSSDVQEEKCIITALSHVFCSRIETSKEVRSAKIIQEAFRRPYDEVAAVKRNGRLRGYFDFGGGIKWNIFC